MADAIDPNPGICAGEPRLAGTRLTVHNVVSRAFLEGDIGVTAEDLGLDEVTIIAAAAYCHNLECVSDPRRQNYCTNCVLRDCDARGLDAIADTFKSTRNEFLLARLVSADSLGDELKRGWELAGRLLSPPAIK